jgi:hypothetical protein
MMWDACSRPWVTQQNNLFCPKNRMQNRGAKEQSGECEDRWFTEIRDRLGILFCISREVRTRGLAESKTTNLVLGELLLDT